MKEAYSGWGLFRLLLALLVVFQHFAVNVAPLKFTHVVEGYETGSVAVLVFFCLSGLFITKAADEVYAGRAAIFLVNRTLRIMPHFLLAMILSIGVQWFFFKIGTLHTERFSPPLPEEMFSAANIVINFFSILPGTNRLMVYAFSPIIWAVQVEVAFYGVMAICIYASARMQRSLGNIVTITFIALLPCFVCAHYGKFPALFGFLPYFSFGASLHFALKGKRVGQGIVALSAVLIAWHFLSQPQYHPQLGFERHVCSQFSILFALIAMMTWLAIPPARKKWWQECAHGIFLFAGASRPHSRSALAPPRKSLITPSPFLMREGYKIHCRPLELNVRHITYPLYLYHYVALMIALNVCAQNNYAGFILGIIGSIMLAGVLSRYVDSWVERWRKRIREKSYQQMPR